MQASSISKVNNANKKALLEAQRNSAEAIEHGKTTLNCLATQDETLRDTEDIVESNEYTLDKTMKVLRGMTWSGMFYNMFNADPHVPDVRGKQSTPSTSSNTKNSASNANKSELIQSSINTLNSVQDDEPELTEISKNISQLLSMSYAIGEQIEQQNDTLNRIENKTERVHDKTLAATLRSAQLTRGSGSSTIQYLGVYQFVEAGTARYLGVVHDSIILVKQADRSTYYNIYMKSGNLMGIQNAKTLKYLGVTMWGTVQASGNTFGKYEECFIDLDGRPSGIVILATNWGGGGWLKLPRQIHLQDKYESEHQVINTEGGIIFPLDTVTTAITDKSADMVVLHAVKAKDGEIDWVLDQQKKINNNV